MANGVVRFVRQRWRHRLGMSQGRCMMVRRRVVLLQHLRYGWRGLLIIKLWSIMPHIGDRRGALHPTSRLENVWDARGSCCSVVLRRHPTSIHRARRAVLILCSSGHGWIVESRNHRLRELDLLPLIIRQRGRWVLILPWRTWRRVSTCAPRRGHHRLDLIQQYRHRWDVRRDLSIWRF